MDIDNKQIDLLYIESILISTGENLNEDLFLPLDIYNAISTIQYKVVDWEHHAGENDEKSEIIGTMGEAWFEDFKGNKLKSDSFDDMPAEFNIATKSVIWKYLFATRAQQIIDGFDDEELAISMEMWFSKYDYAIKQTNGQYKIIKRNKVTTSLSKYLKSNGGIGRFNGQKILRVPRYFTFGGMGIVENPANKRSEIKDIAGQISNTINGAGNIITIIQPIRKIDCTKLVEKLLVS